MEDHILSVGDYVSLLDQVTSNGSEVPWFHSGKIISFDAYGNVKVQNDDGWWAWFSQDKLVKT